MGTGGDGGIHPCARGHATTKKNPALREQGRFTEAAAGLFGSGYVWLTLDPERRELAIRAMKDADNPMQLGLVPLGAHPKSGLQEFLYLRSAKRGTPVPERDAEGALPGGDFDGEMEVLQASLKKRHGLAALQAERLGHLYGSECDAVLAAGQQPLAADVPVLRGEVEFADHIIAAPFAIEIAWRIPDLAKRLAEPNHSWLHWSPESGAALMPICSR